MATKIKTMVEKIVFNEEQLFALKEALSQVGTNKLAIKDVKNMILDQRTKIMEDTIDLLSFYMEQQVQQPVIPSEELSVLKAKVTEREELLEEIGRRLERITGNHRSDSGVLELEIKEFALKELGTAQIQLWLEVASLIDFKKEKITNGYKFLMWSLICVEKYHAYLFGKEDEVTLPNKVRALKLPKKLEDDLLIMVHNRNINAHDIVEIPDAFLPVMEDGFLNLLHHFVNESLIPRIKNRFQFQGSTEVLIKLVQETILSQNFQLELDYNSLFNIIMK